MSNSLVVVVAVPGLRWVDVNEQLTPNLWAFAQRAALGALSVKAAGDHTGCADGMLTLGAGNRAIGTASAEAACETQPGEPAPLDWQGILAANAAENFGTTPGALSDALGRQDGPNRCIGVVGGNAALLASGPSGECVDARTAPVTIVSDVGVYDVASAERAEALDLVDRRLAIWLARLPSQFTMVVGPSDVAGNQRSLHVAMAAGPGFGRGTLTSDSTGRAPYVQLIDVAPTVLTALNTEVPDSMDGRTWEVGAEQVSIEDLAELDAAAVQRLQWGGWWVFMLACSAATVFIFGGLVLTLRLLRGRRPLRDCVQGLCYFVASLPVASWVAHLVIGWRVNVPALFAAVGGVAAVLAAAAFIAARRWPPWGGLAVVVSFTWLVLVLDIGFGTPLQSESLLGDSGIVAGRFAGFGNTASSVFAVSVLTYLGWDLQRQAGRTRQWRLLAVMTAAVIMLWLVGAPSTANDFGGFVTLAAGFTVLFLLVFGTRLRIALLAAAGAGVVAGGLLLCVGLLVDRGHVGRFADDVVNGDAWTTLERKMDASLHSWQTSWHVAVVVLALLTLALLLRRGGPLAELVRAQPLMRAGLLAAAVCAVLGGVVNDSGVVVPGAAALVVVPLLVAACLRAMDTSPVTAP